uniref:Astacin domain-containing protein n=1 Tax=Parastrongyloides trichosuri TaxID=131310 RepID=A0A0N5A7I1_PARTI
MSYKAINEAKKMKKQTKKQFKDQITDQIIIKDDDRKKISMDFNCEELLKAGLISQIKSTISPVSQVIAIYNGGNTLSNDTLMEIINFFNLSNCIRFCNFSKTHFSKGFNFSNGFYNSIVIAQTKSETTVQLNETYSENDVCIRYFFGLD